MGVSVSIEPPSADAGKRAKRQAGLSYAEVLAAAIVLALAIAPAIESLQIGLLGSEVGRSELGRRLRMQGRMEEMLALPFGPLLAEAIAVGDPTQPSSYSDPGGTPDRLLVYLSRYDGDDGDGDGDPFTGVDPGLVWVSVAVDGTPLALESLTTP